MKKLLAISFCVALAIVSVAPMVSGARRSRPQESTAKQDTKTAASDTKAAAKENWQRNQECGQGLWERGERRYQSGRH